MRHDVPSCATLVFVLLLGACDAAAPADGRRYDACQAIQIVPAADATDDERAAVAAAIELWRRRGVSAFTLEPVPGAAQIPLVFEDAALAFFGFYDPESGQVYVNRALTGAHERAVTIAHELGHGLGLVHVSDRTSVMEKANLEIEPTGEDALDVQAIWGACRGTPAP